MLLVQDQYKQGNRKNFEIESQLKQETSKQSFTDPKDTWEGNHEWKSHFPKEIWGLSCEEELLASGIDTDEDEDNFFAEPQDYSEDTHEPHRQFSTGWKKPYKNVRFEGPDFNYVLDTSESSSMENEHPDGDDRGYDERRRSLSQERPVKMTEHLRAPCKSRWRTGECYDKKYERRPKSSPEKSNSFIDGGLERRQMSLEEYGESMDQRQRMRRKEHRCGGRPPHADVDVDHVCGELMNRKSRYKFDCEDNFRRQRHGDYCDHRPLDDAKKNLSKPKSIHKHYMCHARESLDDSILKGYKKSYRDNRPLHDKHFDSFAYHTTIEHCCTPDEFHGKGKKKALEVVQEQQEQYSDSTYKVSCTKASSHTVPVELTGYSRVRHSHERLANSSQSDWLYCSGRTSMDKLAQSHRLHKLRSRRTRMNRLKNGWKKAFVQTIRDGSRNERVGVIVMGPKGPEFYSKNTQQSTTDEAFSNKNPETTQKSFEVMTVDCKNVYLSSFEPRNFDANALPCPEDETKVDEKLANFSKNVNEIVKTSEEKFYKSLSNNGYLEGDKTLAGPYKRDDQRHVDGDENKEDKDSLKKEQHPLLPFETLSPRIPKSLRKREKKFTEESKAMADALNKQAQEYKESQLNPKDRDSYLETLKHLQEEFPHKEITEETAKANLSVWGMKLEHLKEKKDRAECVRELGNGDDGRLKKDENLELTQDEISQTKLEQTISSPRQKSKKSYEAPTPCQFVDNCAGDGAMLSQTRSEMSDKRLTSAAVATAVAPKWQDSMGNGVEDVGGSNKDAEESLISEMFRDLVENGCAISKEESENLQSLFTKGNVETCSNELAVSEASSEALINQPNESKEKTTEGLKSGKGKGSKDNSCLKEKKSNEKNGKETCEEDSDNCLGDANLQKMFKLKSHIDEKIFKKFQSKKKSKKKVILEDKMKALREALPSITAENEAAHLKQLKKYIDRFIERVEASAGSDFPRRKHNRHRSKDAGSTDSSEVRVDARKILDIVNNPFKTISSDVTINIAKKLTDALVQEKSNRSGKTFSGKMKKASEAETDEEKFVHCDASSASGKSPPEQVRLKVETFIREANFFALFTCGILAVCGLVFLVKKCK